MRRRAGIHARDNLLEAQIGTLGDGVLFSDGKTVFQGGDGFPLRAAGSIQFG